MKTLFAAVSALACIVGSTDGFARAGFAHDAGFAYGSGRGFRSVPALRGRSRRLIVLRGAMGSIAAITVDLATPGTVAPAFFAAAAWTDVAGEVRRPLQRMLTRRARARVASRGNDRGARGMTAG
jgi:hypothetical protein